VNERPPYKLRADLIIHRRVFAGEVKYLVKDPLRMRYYTLAPSTYQLLALCDGTRDLGSLLALARRRLPKIKLDAQALVNFYESFRRMHYLEDAWNRNILLIEKRRRNRQNRRTVSPGIQVLGAFDPDRLLNRLVRPLGFLFTRWALVVYGAIILSALWISFTHANEFALSLPEIWTIPGTPLLGLIVLWSCLLGTALLHEFGHSLTCKRFGGEVHRIGIMLLYFSPCFFADVTESMFFEKKSDKQAVTAAGGIVNLLTASCATFVWFFTARDLWVNQLAHRVALYSGVMTVLFNMNPLSRFDGYYLLSTHLELPDLQRNSYHLLGQKIRRLLGLPCDDRPMSRRESRIHWVYGILSTLYLGTAMVLIFLELSHLLVHHYRAAGYVASGLLLFKMSTRYRRTLAGFLRFAATHWAARFRSQRKLYGAAVAALLLALLFVPFPRHLDGAFTLRPGREAAVRAVEAGTVAAVFVEEGDRVRAGAPLARLRQDEAAIDLGRGAALREGAEGEAAAALAAGDLSQAVSSAADARAGGALERFAAERTRLLTPTAPIDGVVLTPRVHEKLGMMLQPGDTLCEVGDARTLRAEVQLDELALGILDPRAPVELRAAAAPWRAVRGRVARVSQEPSGGEVRRLYRVEVEVPNPSGELRLGMSGRARLGAKPAAPVEQLGGWLARILRIEFWV